MAAELTQGDRHLLGVFEGERFEHPQDASEIDRREEVFDIDPEDPLLPKMDPGVGRRASSLDETVSMSRGPVAARKRTG